MDDKKSIPFDLFARQSSAANEQLSVRQTELKDFFISNNCPQNQVDELVSESLQRLSGENKNVNETAKQILKEYFFKYFLEKLDADETAAAEKYIVLHLKIVTKLTWDGCPEYDAENLADRVIDVVAKKVNEIEQKLARGITDENGKEIKEIGNLNSYALEVARLLGLEYYRKHQAKRVEAEELPEIIKPEPPLDETDLRLEFLRKCILKIPEPKDRELIVSYYDTESDEKNKEAREKLRIRLELSKSNLKKKVCLLRQKLEKCINDSLAKLA